MGVFAEGGKRLIEQHCVVQMPPFVQHKRYHFRHLFICFYASPFSGPPPSPYHHHHHHYRHCYPSSIICRLFCVSVKPTITRSVPQSCSESIWLDVVTHLPVIFPYAFVEIWNRVTHCGFSPATPPLHAQIDTKKRAMALLESCSF